MKSANVIRILKKLAWSLGLVGFLIVLGAAGKETLKRPLHGTPHIFIDYDQDLYFVKEEEVESILTDALPRGLANYQLDEVDLSEVERAMETLPYVKNAEVSTDVNGKLTISIEQRAPVARVINSFGVSYYLDQWGEKIPVTDNFTSRVPVITGSVNDNGSASGRVESEVLQEVLQLILFMKDDTFFDALIEQVHVAANGELELVPKVERHTIRLGQALDWREKMERVRLFYQRGLPKAGWKNYSSIDVRFDHQIVCKR